MAKNDKNRVFVLYAAEAIANFLEHLAVQRRNLPPSEWAVWHRFIRNTYERSAVLQEFLREHRQWYSNELLSMTDEYGKQMALEQV